MIGKKHEYALMHESETNFWWYKHLQQQVLHSIEHYFLQQKNIDILDAGCGTGGLLVKLQQQQYNTLHALDASSDAVNFAREKTGLPNIVYGYLQEVGQHFYGRQFDVICCMDVFTYLIDEEIVSVLQQFAGLLKPGGIIITNNNAFKAFKGTHDYHVGVIKRFTAKDFQQYAANADLQVLENRYWNFLLSPLVWTIRKWKLLLHHTGIKSADHIQSDIAMPAAAVNNCCFSLLQFERKWLRNPPWGTSVFTVLQHKP